MEKDRDQEKSAARADQASERGDGYADGEQQQQHEDARPGVPP
jgi:hypothetical protein